MILLNLQRCLYALIITYILWVEVDCVTKYTTPAMTETHGMCACSQLECVAQILLCVFHHSFFHCICRVLTMYECAYYTIFLLWLICCGRSELGYFFPFLTALLILRGCRWRPFNFILIVEFLNFEFSNGQIFIGQTVKKKCMNDSGHNRTTPHKN